MTKHYNEVIAPGIAYRGNENELIERDYKNMLSQSYATEQIKN